MTSTAAVEAGFHTRKPERIVRLTQTEGNGTVCHSWSHSITATFAAAKRPQRSSGQRCAMRERVAGMADGLHGSLAELGAETADVDVDDVGARVEAAAPDLLEQLGARAHLALLEDEVLEQQELARGERHRAVAGVGGAAAGVERDAGGPQAGAGGRTPRRAAPRRPARPPPPPGGPAGGGGRVLYKKSPAAPTPGQPPFESTSPSAE